MPLETICLDTSWGSHLADIVGHSIGALACFFVDCGPNKRIMLVTKNEINSYELHKKLDTSQTANPNASYNVILEVIETARKKHMTGKFIKFNKYKHKKSKWITYGILKSIRFRDNL